MMVLGSTRGSGNLQKQEYALRDFDRVEVSHAFVVELVQGNDFAVTVTADDNILPHVLVEVQHGTLKLGLPRLNSFRNATLRASVTMPKLTSVALSGASRATMNGFSAVDDFSGTLSGASTLIGDVQTASLALELSGVSNLSLSGSAQGIDVSASGASKLNLEHLTAARAKVILSGASKVDLIVTDTLDVIASGASNVSYAGGGVLRSNVSSGMSKIHRK